MAGGGGSDEMNPFISYVDLFSSIIMVLLLFVLIMFVNIGYYMQFNTKDVLKKDLNSTEPKPTPSIVSEMKLQKKEDYKKVILENPAVASTLKDVNTTSAVKGGETDGNTLSKKSEKFAQADFKPEDMIITFKNNEYFLNKDIIQKIVDFLKDKLKTNPNAMFYLSVGDSKNIISDTQAKQVSLGRILSLKNSLEETPALINKIKVSYKQDDTLTYNFGYLKIEVK